MVRQRGVSYKKRVEEINRIYDWEVRRGIPNCEIWRRFMYSAYGITERTLYNILNAGTDKQNRIADDDGIRQPLLFKDEDYE